jgi:hypothetical protein
VGWRSDHRHVSTRDNGRAATPDARHRRTRGNVWTARQRLNARQRPTRGNSSRQAAPAAWSHQPQGRPSPFAATGLSGHFDIH